MVAAQPSSTRAADQSSMDLNPRSSEAPLVTTVELAEEILEEISELATFDNIIGGVNAEENEYDLVGTMQSKPAEDPWSVVLG